MIGGLAVNSSLPVTWDHRSKTVLDMSVPTKWHLIPFSGFSRVHECDRQMDRQTTTVTCCNGWNRF